MEYVRDVEGARVGELWLSPRICVLNLLDITISLQKQSVKALPEEAGIEETVAWLRVIDI